MAVLLDILFRQITTFISVRLAFVFVLQALSSMDFSKFFQLKGLQPKNKGHKKFYDCCDLTKKYIYSVVALELLLLEQTCHLLWTGGRGNTQKFSHEIDSKHCYCIEGYLVIVEDTTQSIPSRML